MKKFFIFFISIFIFHNLSFSQEDTEIFNLACITDTYTEVGNSGPETRPSGQSESFQVGFSKSKNITVIQGCGFCNAIGTYEENSRKYSGKCKNNDLQIEKTISIDRVTGSFMCMLTLDKNGTDGIGIIITKGSCEKAKNKF